MELQEAIEAIRARLSLREVVGRYVALRPAGRGRYKGLCPFHTEKTPSFYVDEEKGLFHCFGCKAGGDLFAFVQRIEGLEFREALERLAEEAGVELPKGPGGGGRKRELLEVLKLAQAYFRAELQKAPEALAYLKARGLTEKTIDRFGLGYAPPKGDGLLRHLLAQGISPEEGLKAGVLVEREGRYWDRLRGRITFPIPDALGRTVGFTGRVLGEGEPKYLNTPETPLFRKRETLFGLPQARPHLEGGRAILVEGLFDAIALHQLGFPEAVAVLGAGLAPEQAGLLARAGVVRVYLAFDRDEAGRRATLGSLDGDLARRFLFYAILLPVKDPGDLLLHPEGRALFQKALEEALPEVELRIEEALRGLDLKTQEGRRRFLQALTPRMLSLDPLDPVAEELKARVAERLGISRERLEEYLKAQRKGVKDPTPPGPKAQDPVDRTLLLELDAIALLLSAPEDRFLDLVLHAKDQVWPKEGSLLGEFLDLAAREPRKAFLRHHLARKEAGGLLFERLLLAPVVEEPRLKEKLDHALARVREAYLKERLALLKARLKEGPEPGLLKEIAEVQQAIEAERRIYRKV